MIPSSLRNSILAAAGALALALPLSAPAQADPPWRHGDPPGWSRHHDRPPRHGWRDWDDRPVIHRRGPAYYVYEYERPRVLYLPPPPVVYLPPRSAGVDIHLPLPLP
jgi:hypothetical protein